MEGATKAGIISVHGAIMLHTPAAANSLPRGGSHRRTKAETPTHPCRSSVTVS